MKKKIKQKTSVTDHLFHIKKKTHWENSQRNYFALFRVVVQKQSCYRSPYQENRQ